MLNKEFSDRNGRTAEIQIYINASLFADGRYYITKGMEFSTGERKKIRQNYETAHTMRSKGEMACECV